tara:strand:+ start:821 stop:1006 length:186 start_codon:yes stop_codon:yes gene_type:complete
MSFGVIEATASISLKTPFGKFSLMRCSDEFPTNLGSRDLSLSNIGLAGLNNGSFSSVISDF